MEKEGAGEKINKNKQINKLLMKRHLGPTHFAELRFPHYYTHLLSKCYVKKKIACPYIFVTKQHASALVYRGSVKFLSPAKVSVGGLRQIAVS
jgi:hypothetical protein